MAKISSPIVAPPLTDAMYVRGRATVRNAAHDVVKAKYDRRTDVLVLMLRSGIRMQFPRKRIRELKSAAPQDIAKIEVQPGGDGISIRELDVDIYVPGLLADELGSVFAKAMGRRTRGRTSAKKAAASRANGRRGGRPPKASAAK